SGRGQDPGGAGQGGGRLGGLLLHQGGGDGGGGPGGDGRPRRAGADVQAGQGGLGRRPAAGAQRLQQRGLLQPVPVDVQPGGGLGLGPARGGAGGPPRQPVG